jgi:hypothetical protein
MNIEDGSKLEIPALAFPESPVEERLPIRFGSRSAVSLFARRNSNSSASSISSSDGSISSAPSNWNKQVCFGIHSLAINPSRTLLAVGYETV